MRDVKGSASVFINITSFYSCDRMCETFPLNLASAFNNEYGNIWSPLQALANLVLRVLTFSYSGAYAYHTVNPIENIQSHQQYQGTILRDELVRALAHFRHTKSEELSFVSRAVCENLLTQIIHQVTESCVLRALQAALSAAAVIGVFSWPTAETTVWAAKMLWNWSFFMSSFSLISSAHQRLLRHLPEGESSDCSDEKLQLALNLFLQPPVKPASLSAKPESRRISKRMLWIWQCPVMLMSYSWVLFLVGYALHVLTPVFGPSQAEVSSKVSQDV